MIGVDLRRHQEQYGKSRVGWYKDLVLVLVPVFSRIVRGSLFLVCVLFRYDQKTVVGKVGEAVCLPFCLRGLSNRNPRPEPG